MSETAQSVEIYGLRHPETGDLRYIGKANNALERLKSHIRDSRRRRTPVNDWIQSLLKVGLTPEIIVIQTCTVAEWPDLERGYITTARGLGHRLLNLAEGGTEPYCSYEVRAANARKNAAARVADPVRKDIWRLQILVANLKRDGILSEEKKEHYRAMGRQYPNVFGTWINL